jgi:hypothetical protein
MNIKINGIIIIVIGNIFQSSAQEKQGAAIPWTTYEAEQMRTTGTVMGPDYHPYQVETESSGQQCVKLAAEGQFVEFTATKKANSMVIRYSLPDKTGGKGLTATLGIYKNGNLIRHDKISSRYAWLYGKYPFTNDPAAGQPRHFYDEIRIKELLVAKGDVIRIKLDNRRESDANYCIIDLVDLENVPPPLKQPANSLSIADKRFQESDFNGDYTKAFGNCIAKAGETGETVWIPAGTFKIAGDIILPPNITVQGAGMWYTELVGEEGLYTQANRRVRVKGTGSNIHIADLSITGNLDYRNDREDNDGIVGSFGTNSTISRIWIEHTKVGMWIDNSSNLKITGCRMRNTMADGINFCIGMANSSIENCSARGTGDDCFAIWPAVFKKQEFSPGHNLISRCTAQLPYLANGAAIYGGNSNRVKDCSFADISQGSAILVSTTFPTESKDKTINNNFSGLTLIEDCTITRSGGFDHEWDWRAAIEICLDKRSISHIAISNLSIMKSLSDGFSVVAKNEPGATGLLANATLQNIRISGFGMGAKDKHALFISAGAHGSLTIKNSHIPDSKNESEDFEILRSPFH